MIALGGRRASRLVIGMTAAIACLGWAWVAGAQARDFEIPTFVAPGVSKDQSPSTGAGARPFELVNNFAVSQTPTPEELFNGGHVGPSGNVKDIEFQRRRASSATPPPTPSAPRNSSPRTPARLPRRWGSPTWSSPRTRAAA